MNILVTGGTGVIGEGVIPELISRGHSVRERAADECDVVLHIGDLALRDGIAEAARAGVKRFVYVSPDPNREAEQLVQQSSLDWTIVRPGIVYGPGDEGISTILKMVRALPAVPVVDGNQEFQPLWHEDLAKVLAAVAERDDLSRRILEVAGPDITTVNDLLRRFAEITDRSPLRVPVPAMLATKLQMLVETNILCDENALDLLGIKGTNLDDGLRMLADLLPEALPEDGVGALEHKHFRADIRGSRYTAASLMTLFRERVNEFMPIDFVAEPGAPDRVEKGATLTGALPLRGNFQVRVEIAEPTHVVFATIEGHPLSGIVEFTSSDTADGVSFSIDVYARASNFFDWIAAHTVGAPAQNANWRTVVQRVIDASGGTSDGVHEEKEKLDKEEAAAVEKRVRGIVQDQKRATSQTPASKRI